MKLKDLRNDKDFIADVDECLKNIMEIPSLRKQMQTMFGELEDIMIEQKATQSIQAASKVRRNLAHAFRKKEYLYEKEVNRMVEETSKTNAARAMRIGKLLTKPWFE